MQLSMQLQPPYYPLALDQTFFKPLMSICMTVQQQTITLLHCQVLFPVLLKDLHASLGHYSKAARETVIEANSV